MTSPEDGRAAGPVRVDAELDTDQSRWLWLVKWLLVLPHYVVLAFLWAAFVLLSVVALVAIVATGRYPRGIFDFNVGVLRWSWRVAYYAYGALGTDRYPPFTLADVPDYPAHVSVEYPEHLSRGLALVKWWLLALPHYLVVGFLVSGAAFTLRAGADSDSRWAFGGGLIGLLVLVAAVMLLFTGRYPQPLYDLILGLNRWVIRVAAYAALMTDRYPPFRLDQGGAEPGVTHPQVVGDPSHLVAGAPASAVGAPPPAPRPWTAGRVTMLVVGSILAMAGLGAGAAGVTLGVADVALRDDAGYVMSGTQDLDTPTYALVSPDVELRIDAAAERVPEWLFGTVKVTARSADGPLFLGVASSDDVETYLADVEHATVTDLTGSTADPVYETSPGGAPTTPPGLEDFWAETSQGSGTREITWAPENGVWRFVVMNADGSAVVDTEVSVGATVPALRWAAVALTVLAALLLVVALTLLVLAVRSLREA